MTRCQLALALVLSGCGAGIADGPPTDEWDDRLADRVVDYNAALRTAALRLTGELPTLAEIKEVAAGIDDAAQRAVYETTIAGYLTTPAFARQMVAFWRDTLKMGGDPLLDSAPAFVARLAVENGSFLEVFTATDGTCPGFDPMTASFTPGDCVNLSPETAGLLTHPGVNAHFFSNFGFRRVRWVQETFACTAFPAELADQPVEVGGLAPYTGTFPFDSIAGGPGSDAVVDFRETSSVICANCHANMNHIAPLFAHFDATGTYRDGFVVPTPVSDEPIAKRRDYLPDGEPLAWRHGIPIAGMTGLGNAIAADPEVASCTIARLWNWALGKPDIVDTLTTVPAATIQGQVDAFVGGGHRLRDAIYRIYTSDDFVRF
jgi:hypothetical protein